MPRITSIAGFPNAAPGAVALKIPCAACSVPCSGKKVLCIIGVHDEVYRTGHSMGARHFECFLPGFPAIYGAVNASCVIGRIQGSKCSNVCHGGVVGVQDDLADVLGFGQSEVLPRHTVVVARVNAGTGIRAAG